ncbi:MAG: B12-binding domain-containing radical SAM protein, partial [Polyangiaceae bacterium]|nr:B12-binding domain-containing radical SAM protein [Polyangiaceae bacterium]
MHILLVGPDLEENLSLRYLASSLRAAGHRATIARFDTMEDFHQVVELAAGTDLVGLSLCYQIRAREYLCLARTLKEQAPARAVVAGGHYASCAAQDVLARHAELDVIVVHEGERTLVELANIEELSAAALGGIPGIVYRDGAHIVATRPREILTDLDSLPWPDRTGPARLLAGVPSAYMMGSRGCLGACDYCCISTLHRMVPGRKFRQRNPEKIADEMAWLYHRRGVRQFIFHDDNFLVPSVARNRERIDGLDRALRARRVGEIGLALKCRPADVTREVFTRLREMGLLRVFLGIESGTEAGLASIGRRQSLEEEHRALDLCKELGISTQYTIIIFHPEATPESMLQDLAFVRRHLTQPFSFCRAEIYTGTPLEQRMIQAGRARGDYLARTYEYSHPGLSRLWEAGQTLLHSRCWAQNHLLGQVVRLDHLVTIYGHFYEGSEVEALVEDFAALKLEINRDSVELFEAMIGAYVELHGAELDARLEELAERERVRRDGFQRRLCAINETLHQRALSLVGLVRRTDAMPAVAKNRLRAPRHSAAALLAAGLIACGGEPSDDDGPNDSGGQSGTATGGTHNTGGFVNTGGMFEAPPPPMGGSGGTATGGTQSTGGTATGGTQSTGGFVNTGGMFEAPPPPMGGSGGTA